MVDILQYNFIQNAIIASFLASVVCGIVGVIIVQKKLVMMSGGIAHTSYGGVGLGYFLGFEPIIGALIVSVSAALGIGYVKRKGMTSSDVIIGIFWSLGMSLGILFIALMPGYPPDLSSYLFGSILTVTQLDLIIMIILAVLVLLVVTTLFNYWQSYMFDDEYAYIMGINTAFLEYLLLVLIALSVVALIRVVGIILVIALLSSPSAIAGMLAQNLKLRMLFAIIIGSIFCLLGLALSYLFNIASGATIVILASAGYLFVYLIVKDRTISS